MNIRNNIARIGATALIGCGLIAATVPATFAEEAITGTVHTYLDSAKFFAPDTWIEGQPLTVAGEGFKTADGASGSVLALKLNKGSVKIDGQDYLEIHADESGNFSVTIPWQEALRGKVSVDIYLLSGSLKDGDVPRGGKAATVTIKVADTPDPTTEPTPEPTQNPTPAPTQDSTTEPTQDPTPEPTQDSTTEPTQGPTEEPSPSASEGSSAPAAGDTGETQPAEEKSSEEQKPEDQAVKPSEESKQYKYQNCADVWADRGTSIFRGDPDFRDKFDADGDGEGCEREPGYTNDEDSKSSGTVSFGSSNDNNRGSGSSSLANTGASSATTATGLGLIALGAGSAVVVATRLRKKA